MARSSSTEGGSSRQGTGRAFAGVFDPRRTAPGEAMRRRLAAALEPDGSSTRRDEGSLASAWASGIEYGHSPDRGALCLLDGAIYDHGLLAEELGLGLQASPAALLAEAFAAVGADLLPRLRGDFAFLVWDREAERGLIARDQLGGRSLFFHAFPGGIAFASEMRNLTRLLPRTPRPDPVAVRRWFVPALTLPGRTLLEGVEELGPAGCMELGAETTRPFRYWKPRYRKPLALDREDAAELVSASLRQAVGRRTASPEATAILLSGGIDSSSVAGIAASALGSHPRASRSYSVALPGHPELDEGPLVESVAAHLGLRATRLRLESGGLLSGALPFIGTWEVPPITTTLFFLYPLLQRASRDGVGVLLDGEGGDSVFWHASSLPGDRLRRGRLFAAWSLVGRLPAYGGETTYRTRIRRLRQQSTRPQPRRLSLPSWLADEHWEEADLAPPTAKWDGPLWWAELVDGILGLGSEMMHHLSRRHAALSGIEPRHPLLDVDLVELALSLPPELAFDRRYNRPVLRHAVAGLVPDEVRLRPYKSHFDPVLIAGLKADLPVIERLLLGPGAETGAYVHRRRLEAHLASPPRQAAALREWSKEIWFLTTLECWLRQQGGGDPIPAELTKDLQMAQFEFVGP